MFLITYLFALFERILFDGHDDDYNIDNRESDEDCNDEDIESYAQ